MAKAKAVKAIRGKMAAKEEGSSSKAWVKTSAKAPAKAVKAVIKKAAKAEGSSSKACVKSSSKAPAKPVKSR